MLSIKHVSGLLPCAEAPAPQAACCVTSLACRNHTVHPCALRFLAFLVLVALQLRFKCDRDKFSWHLFAPSSISTDSSEGSQTPNSCYALISGLRLALVYLHRNLIYAIVLWQVPFYPKGLFPPQLIMNHNEYTSQQLTQELNCFRHPQNWYN